MNTVLVPGPDVRDLKGDVEGVIQRFTFEHELLVSRTGAILALNGLMAAAEAMGENLPWLARLTLAAVMIVINALWWWRAWRATQYIRLLRNEMYDAKYKKVLPVHAQLHKKRDARQWFPSLASERLFASVIMGGLVACWIVGIVTVATTTPSSAPAPQPPAAALPRR